MSQFVSFYSFASPPTTREGLIYAGDMAEFFKEYTFTQRHNKIEVIADRLCDNSGREFFSAGCIINPKGNTIRLIGAYPTVRNYTGSGNVKDKLDWVCVVKDVRSGDSVQIRYVCK